MLPDQAAKVKDVFHGRQFDGNAISASFSTEADYARAAAGEWLPDAAGSAPAAAAAVHVGLSPVALPPAPALPSLPAGFQPGAMPNYGAPRLTPAGLGKSAHVGGVNACVGDTRRSTSCQERLRLHRSAGGAPVNTVLTYCSV